MAAAALSVGLCVKAGETAWSDLQLCRAGEGGCDVCGSMGRVVAALQQEGVLLLGVLMLLELVTKAGVSLLDFFSVERLWMGNGMTYPVNNSADLPLPPPSPGRPSTEACERTISERVLNYKSFDCCLRCVGCCIVFVVVFPVLVLGCFSLVACVSLVFLRACRLCDACSIMFPSFHSITS